jgi:FkbM family methyltransferase
LINFWTHVLQDLISFLDKLVQVTSARGMRFLSITIANARFLLLGSPERFKKGPEAFILRGRDTEVKFSNWRRGAHIYRRGLDFRIKQLEDAYCLESVAFTEPRGLVIDCGANYGDFSRAVLRKLPDARLALVEPVPWDASNLRSSFPDASVFELAASDSDGEAQFFLSESSGDSSLFRPKTRHHEIKVAQKRLDQAISLQDVFLIKVEAEGGEPEVLIGSLRLLSRTKYVVVDGGPERGLEGSSTIDSCTKILLDNGFSEIARSATRPQTVLFKRQRNEVKA